MAFVRELFVLLGVVLVSVFCADNDTTPAPPTPTPPTPTPASASTPASTGTMTDLAQFVLKFPFSIWSLCKYGADTMKGIASSVMPPING
ncbi:unnamed protein product [Arctia plantaginis]|uniref:Uncharacterized protein n=1 Tax=Arctia plantaginis TaxID=874455 RepID=A0A8S0Z8V9_ARCPL|nr:unnamed protein product [Arctia plantaginis]